MSWPTPQDYQEAMQNPHIALGDVELQRGKAEVDRLGLPRPISGGFASVYKVVCPSRSWAVRCFLKEFQDQQKRYAAISTRLKQVQFPFATQFEFISQGIRIRGHWYPILKMEWVQGESLIRFVENNIQSPSKLASIGLDIIGIVRVLNQHGMAHGDLQHGNILVANGTPKLIDYDGMYVPALKGWKTHEAGHPNYQLPRDESDYGPALDNFSVWVIYLSLRALSVRPSLWTQFKGGDDCLLFRRTDFESPAQSAILQELKRFPESEIRQLAVHFETLLSHDPLQIPLIDPNVQPSRPTPNLPSWLPAYKSPAPTPQSAPGIQPGPQWAVIDQIPSPNTAYTRPPSPAARTPTPWPPTLARTAPPKPSAPSILVSPPAWAGPAGLQPIPQQPALPSILVSPPAWNGPNELPPIPPEPGMPYFLVSSPVWSGPTNLPPIPPKPVMPAVLVSPPKWPAPKDLPPIPPKPVLSAIVTAPPHPPAMHVPPMQHQQQVVPVAWDQRLLGNLALILGVLVPLGLVGGILASSGRFVAAAVCLVSVPLCGFLLVGLFWLMLERERRQNERRINQEYDDELARLRDECKRKKRKWEAELAANQAEAKARYNQEVMSYNAAVAANQAEAQQQRIQWEAELARKQAQARQTYNQEVMAYNVAISANQAETTRQRSQWEAELAGKQAQARKKYEQDMASWQGTVSHIETQRKLQQQEWNADLAAKQKLARQEYERDVQVYNAAISANQAETERQRKQWESDIAAQQSQARHQYDQEVRSWQTTVNAMRAEKARRQNAVKDLQGKLAAAEQNYNSVADRFAREFQRQKAEVPQLKRQYDDVENQRAVEWQQFVARTREKQLTAYLQQQRLEDAAIPDIGAGRKRTLKVNGVHNAWDISEHRIMSISGFGPALTANLMAWRRTVESTFSFKAATAISAQDRQAFESQYQQRRDGILRRLSTLETTLKQLSHDAEKELTQIRHQIGSLLTQLWQAEADMAAIPPGL